MAETVINNPGMLRSDEGSAAAGWIIALLVLAAIALGAFYVVPRMQAPAASAPTDTGTNINVTLPEGALPGTNNNGSENNTGNQNPNPAQ